MASEKLLSVLVVDDEASNLHILNQILKERYVIYAARTGRAALKIADDKRPDIVLLDVILPDMNGCDVLMSLKASNNTHDIPVVIISGLKGDQNEQKCIRLGAVGYITKPFNSAVLKETVDECLKCGRQER